MVFLSEVTNWGSTKIGIEGLDVLVYGLMLLVVILRAPTGDRRPRIQERGCGRLAGERGLALEVNGICRNFGGVVALRDVSFTVRAGEVVGLIGPNGAGKSTLFEIVSGNLAPSAGRISYFGTDCTAMPTHLRRRAGMCRTFQKVRLFDSMTVAENIRVAASQCLPPGRDLRDEVAAILAQLRLEAQADAPARRAHARRPQAGRDRPRDRRPLPPADARRKHVRADPRGGGAPDRRKSSPSIARAASR